MFHFPTWRTKKRGSGFLGAWRRLHWQHVEDQFAGRNAWKQSPIMAIWHPLEVFMAKGVGTAGFELRFTLFRVPDSSNCLFGCSLVWPVQESVCNLYLGNQKVTLKKLQGHRIYTGTPFQIRVLKNWLNQAANNQLIFDSVDNGSHQQKGNTIWRDASFSPRLAAK